MDHLDAKRLQAAEKYVLGELTPELRDEYEEHYFDCADCTEEVQAAMAFVDTSKEVFREAEFAGAPEQQAQRGEVQRVAARASAAPEASSGFSAWFSWLRPAIAVPAMAALVAIIVYQNVTGVPGAHERGAAQSQAQAYAATFRVQGSTRGGAADSELSRIVVAPNEAFALDFDFTPAQTFASYQARLQDASGKTVFSAKIPGDLTNKEVHLPVPAGLLRPGPYSLAIVGDNGTAQIQDGDEAQRLRFAVESRP